MTIPPRKCAFLGPSTPQNFPARQNFPASSLEIRIEIEVETVRS